MAAPTPSSIVLTGLGIASSVGVRSTEICAAIRAGVTRPRPLRDLAGFDGDALETVPLIAHPVGSATEGFYKLGRWLELGRICLGDLLSDESARTPGAFQGLALHLVTRPLDEEFLQEELAPAQIAALVDQALAAPLCAAAGLPCGPADRRLFPHGAAGTAAAIREAGLALAQGRYRRVLVLAVDSWIDPTLIDLAESAGRLKAHDNPMGLSPGEAAVALLLERMDNAQASGRPPLAMIENVGMRTAPVSPLEEPEVAAPSLCEAIEEALPANARAEDVFVDLTGEEWRARQWGTGLVRLGPRLGGSRVHVPAVSVGDVGAASGALGIGLAAQSFRRRWARGDRALVVSVSETGESSGVVITRAA